MTNPYIQLTHHYRNSREEDAYRQNRNHNQLENLTSTPTVNIDAVLAGKNEDDRLGCCIITRPNENVKSLIFSIQSKLKASVSNSAALWIPPSEYLHMSVLEIANSSTQNRIKQIVNILMPHIDQLLTIANNGPELSNPLICFDATAIALTFTSVDRSHIKYRLELFDSVTSYGVDIHTRYHAPSAHISIIRFVEDICEDDLMALLDQIQVINSSLVKTKWKVSNCEFNYGLIWYGQRVHNA